MIVNNRFRASHFVYNSWQHRRRDDGRARFTTAVVWCQVMCQVAIDMQTAFLEMSSARGLSERKIIQFLWNLVHSSIHPSIHVFISRKCPHNENNNAKKWQRNWIWCILDLKSDIWWQQFQWFFWESTDQISCSSNSPGKLGPNFSASWFMS